MGSELLNFSDQTANDCTMPTSSHTDQYLQGDSHHSLSSKYSVIGTLTHRAKVVCTDLESLQGGLKHLRSALGKCNYPTWAIKRVQQKVLHNNQEDTSTNNSINNNNTSTNNNDNNINNQGSNPTINAPRNKTTIGQTVIPYTKGISKSIKQACGKYGIQEHFKGYQTIKQILMKPKDKDPKDSKSGIIYSYQCPHLDCDEEYMRNIQVPRAKKKGTPKTTFSYTQACPNNRTFHRKLQLQHHRKGGLGAGQDN